MHETVTWELSGLNKIIKKGDSCTYAPMEEWQGTSGNKREGYGHEIGRCRTETKGV